MFNEIFDKIREFDNIVIARHIGVDPDALCSSLALRDSIKLTFPEKKVIAVGSGSHKFKSIGNIDKYEVLDNALLIVCDTPDLKRVDTAKLDDFKYSIKIDHHPFIQEYCNYEYIDDKKSSTCEILMEMFEDTPLECDQNIASLLYMGLVSDSNRFLFNSCTANTFALVSRYMYKYNLLLDNAIQTEYQVDSAAAGNMINNFNYIDGVPIWMTITEDVRNKIYRISVRSRGIVVNKVCEKYNGGGHQFASGARVKTLEEAICLVHDLNKLLEVNTYGD